MPPREQLLLDEMIEAAEEAQRLVRGRDAISVAVVTPCSGTSRSLAKRPRSCRSHSKRPTPE